MKIGVLTFHSQLNYGGVLQCWALKTALERMGHEVVVIDRWMSPDNSLLDGPFGKFHVKEWLGIIIRSLAGCGTWQIALRHWRTRKFVRTLGLTSYHFYEWRDAPKILDVDCLVVGSDQVWHGGDWGFPSPDPYLLVEAPRVKAIAYAASFGLKSLPSGCDYAAGFERFSAISVREEDGVGLVKDCGYAKDVRHVLDPTLLLGMDVWKSFVPRELHTKRLVCYLLDEDINSSLPVLNDWARKRQWTVRIVSNGFSKPFPKSISMMARRIYDVVLSFFSRVEIASGLGPREFVREFAQADAVVTDSFHAVAFSMIYGIDCRFLKPQSVKRIEMFSRIKSLMNEFIQGEFLSDSLVDALRSIQSGGRSAYRLERVEKRRAESTAWITEALGGL